MANLKHPELPGSAGEEAIWSGLRGSAASLALARAASQHEGVLCVITADARTAEMVETELKFYASEHPFPVLRLPDPETLPFDIFSPHPDIISERLETLYHLPQLRQGILVVAIGTLMQYVPPCEYVTGYSLVVDVGERIDRDALARQLDAAGYTHNSQVVEHGDFAIRGSLLDVFPMGAMQPYRIDLFDDEVESIRAFNPETQISEDPVNRVRVLPAREFPLEEAAIKQFRQRYRARFEGNPQNSLVYRDVSAGLAPGGIEFYLPLFFEQTASVFDYLPEHTTLVIDPDIEGILEANWQQITERYEQRRHNVERPILRPEEVFLDGAYFRQHAERLPRVRLALNSPTHEHTAFDSEDPPSLLLNPRASAPARELADFIDTYPGRVLLAAESAGRREALLDTLAEHRLKPKRFGDWAAFLQDDQALGITIAPLERGLLLADTAIITEPQLFGERVRQRRRAKAARDPASIIRNLTDLSVGSPVVHEDHGVGRYLGLQKLTVGGNEAEFLALEYASGDKLYVPVSALHLISRYTGTDPEHAPLHRLGSEQWERARRKAAQKAYDVAAELLEVQARRAANRRDPITLDAEAYRSFAAQFPFEETPDQLQTIEAVIQDLTSPNPMDRVVCGDVGFGKTEVAMRAAFVAAHAGRQVAVLVPTTLLAQQHHQNFRDRFADWPIRVEVLSRMHGTKQQKAVMEGLTSGQVDVVIATHKLLGGSVRFRNLGLVVIDEEHRFGVRHKEKLKNLRAEVDVLTLTATPIPRTLNMSMAGLRDLSIIATPPVERAAVRTFVSEWDDALIVEACQREIKRGGQVFFLHNEVQTIERMAHRIEELIPQGRVLVAHGQMPERALEQAMLDFYHRRANILVCSTIIESGIDIPTANTIIINRADRLGLAQLHQLRGRVGRSHHRAYAYLLAPPREAITPDAAKRLEAIESLGELGSGFTLATNDLEIRGAGELLGAEQSGHIQEVGFSLYQDLLDRAVKALKRGDLPDLTKGPQHGAEVDLGIPALLPDTFVPDVDMRLILYKRIANAEDENGLRELQVELIDRFGLLPEPTRHLFEVTQAKLRADTLGVRKLDAGPKGIRIQFQQQPAVAPEIIIDLIQKQPDRFRLEGQDTLRCLIPSETPAERVERVDQVLKGLETGAMPVIETESTTSD